MSKTSENFDSGYDLLGSATPNVGQRVRQRESQSMRLLNYLRLGSWVPVP